MTIRVVLVGVAYHAVTVLAVGLFVAALARLGCWIGVLLERGSTPEERADIKQVAKRLIRLFDKVLLVVILVVLLFLLLFQVPWRGRSSKSVIQPVPVEEGHKPLTKEEINDLNENSVDERRAAEVDAKASQENEEAALDAINLFQKAATGVKEKGDSRVSDSSDE